MSTTYIICKDHMTQEVMLGRRSLIEYVRTSITEVMLGRRPLIEYVRTTGHRGNARTSTTYRVCKDHRSQR